MIDTKKPYACLVAVGLPNQTAFLEVYAEEDPELHGTSWDGIIGDGSDRVDPETVFDENSHFFDFPHRPGMWVWEGTINWTSGIGAEGRQEGSDPILRGSWRRANLEEVKSWANPV